LFYARKQNLLLSKADHALALAVGLAALAG
jgi:hypothetical protein